MIKITNLLLAGLLILAGFQLKAQPDLSPAKGQFTIVTNPTYFALGGYHIKPSYHFPKRWSVGMTLQGGFELPEFARDQFFEVRDEATTVDWDYAIGLELKYRFTEASYDKGFFTSLNLGYEGWQVNNEIEDSFSNWFTSLEMGYHWYPFKKQRLHFGAAYALIFILNNTNERGNADNSYRIQSVVPPSFAPSLFVGWRL